MKAAVIGGGIAGLASAIRLKHAGFEVDLFERNSYLGGKLASFSKNGYRFDKGPSLFTLPNFVDELFTLFDKNPRDYFNYNALSTACVYFDEGKRLSASTNQEEFIEEAEEKLGVDRKRLKEYLDYSRDLYSLSAPMFVEGNGSLASVNGMKLTAKALRKGAFNSLNSFNQKWLKNAFLVKIFNRFATYNGSNPYQTKGILSCIASLEHSLGAYFPVGGMVEIPNTLVKLGKEVGVNYLTNNQVTSIKRSKKQWEVASEKSITTYDTVVYNGDVYQLENLLELPKVVDRPVVKEMSTSAVVFYWGIKRTFKNLDVHNIFFAKDYEHEFLCLNEGVVSDDPTVYVHISNKIEESDAPKDAENWFVMVNVPPGEISQLDLESIRSAIMKKMKQELGVDLQNLIEVEEVLTPQLISKSSSSYKGALYGLNSNSIQNMLSRPRNKTKYKGFYLAGGTVFPGGGIPLCLSSAKLTVETIVKDLSK